MRERAASTFAAHVATQRPHLLRERLGARCDPYDAVLTLRGDRRPTALIGRWLGGGAILASEPLVVAEPSDDPFALLASQPQIDPDEDGAIGIGGGWFGMLGYELGRRLEPVPAAPPARAGAETRPPFSLGYYDHLLRQDEDGVWWFEALWTPARDRELRRRRRLLLDRLAQVQAPRAFRVGAFAACAPGFAGHRVAIERCVERIAAGEIFQANLCVRLEATWEGDPLDVFATAGRALRPDYGALVVDEGRAVVSLSPELFLRRTGRELVSEPIKGTAARSTADPDSAAVAEALAVSAKNRAENVMIVDLMRNDLGRVAEIGSVHVVELAEPRSHPGVWHLVSTVGATVREHLDDADVVRAAFPPGSVTGAPKVQALRVISELEASAREAYTGSIGVATPTAGLELSVTIRTFEISGDTIALGVGGGIVADSDPDAELAECLHKATPIVAAAGSHIVDPRPPRRPPARVPWALEVADGGRPDPGRGVFTTARVGPGSEELLGWHVERLRASVLALYGQEPPAGWDGRMVDLARSATAPARLRADVIATDDGPPRLELTLSSIPHRPDAPLRPVLLPGGLGTHKWRDRRLLDELAVRLDGIPLLIDADGCILEAGHAAVLLREGDGLIAPPEDRALLPSLGLRAVATAGSVRHEPFDLDRARAADEILLVSALRAPRAARLELP